MGEHAVRGPSVLVAIASYGTAQDHYLKRVVDEYKKLDSPCRIVVLSNAPKLVDGAEVRVGLPSANPYSLPFAHRALFAEEVDHYDLFIYTEDDTLLTPSHIDAFLMQQARLREDEILGFIRSEVSPDGQRFITSIHHHFRWLPETAEERDGELFAQLSNLHSGCFIATQAQLRAAIASGGFLVPPHDETYGMLESAASDIYTQCGLRRLLCVSRIESFIVPHLPNKYFMQMGIPLEELRGQVGALQQVHGTGGWRGSLFEPESRAPEFRWSKDLYEKPDAALLNNIPENAREVLSIGVGSGLAEEDLRSRGMNVHAVALDAVFARTLRTRGIAAVEGSLVDALGRLPSRSFDAILAADVLHLVEHPSEWLRELRSLLVQGGRVVLRVQNTGDVWAWLRDWRRGRLRTPKVSYQRTGVQSVSTRQLRTWCRLSGLNPVTVVPVLQPGRRQRLGWLGRPFEAHFASSFIVTAQRTD